MRISAHSCPCLVARSCPPAAPLEAELLGLWTHPISVYHVTRPHVAAYCLSLSVVSAVGAALGHIDGGRQRSLADSTSPDWTDWLARRHRSQRTTTAVTVT
jgi:hypothetical protein